MSELTNPAVPNNTEVDTLLIEKFIGTVHKQYLKGESLLSDFMTQNVVGTNMVSNKTIGTTTLQTLTPGQKPKATKTEMNKNALLIDTIVLGRNTVHSLHDIQNDFEVMTKLAENQVGQINIMEDQMIIQQVAAGALTGGTYDPYANTITGGVSRAAGQGVAINVELNDDDSQAADPYQLMSALEIALMGLIIQRVPVGMMKIIVPISEFGILNDYKFIGDVQGGDSMVDASMAVLRGKLKGWNIPIMGSAEFTQMKLNPHFGETHHLLSNDNNGNRYDVTAEMQAANALIYAQDGLLTGRTITLQGDIWFEKDDKSFVIDSWLSEGAIADRYDNLAVIGSTGSGDNAAVLAKAKGKSTATKVYA